MMDKFLEWRPGCGNRCTRVDMRLIHMGAFVFVGRHPMPTVFFLGVISACFRAEVVAREKTYSTRTDGVWWHWFL